MGIENPTKNRDALSLVNLEEANRQYHLYVSNILVRGATSGHGRDVGAQNTSPSTIWKKDDRATIFRVTGDEPISNTEDSTFLEVVIVKCNSGVCMVSVLDKNSNNREVKKYLVCLEATLLRKN